MKQLLWKLIFITAVFVGVNAAFCGYAAACGAPTIVPWKIGCPVLLVLLYPAGVLTEALFPERSLRPKKIFRTVSMIQFLLTLGLWSVVIFLYTVWIWFLPAGVLLGVILYIQKRKIRKQFRAYLQKQGIPETGIRSDHIRFSLWRILRNRSVWIAETELVSEPERIRTYGYHAAEFIPES